MSSVDLLALRLRQLQKRPEDLAKAAATLKKHRFQAKDQFERRYKTRLVRDSYPPGTLVLVRNKAKEGGLEKHHDRYLGPYEVVRRTRNGAYILQELRKTELGTKILDDVDFYGRFDMNFITIFAIFAELYGYRNDCLDQLVDLITMCGKSWLDRNPELKKLDKARELDPAQFEADDVQDVLEVLPVGEHRAAVRGRGAERAPERRGLVAPHVVHVRAADAAQARHARGTLGAEGRLLRERGTRAQPAAQLERALVLLRPKAQLGRAVEHTVL